MVTGQIFRRAGPLSALSALRHYERIPGEAGRAGLIRSAGGGSTVYGCTFSKGRYHFINEHKKPARLDANRGGTASSFMPTDGGRSSRPGWMPTGAALLPASCRPAGADLPGPDGCRPGRKNIFLIKIREKYAGNCQKMAASPYFTMLPENLCGGVDKRFYPVLIFNHADGVKPRNKTTETKGE